MEMQFFILGHIILLAICVGRGVFNGVFEGDDFGDIVWGAGYMFFALFIPLEIIYWGLHWWLVP